MLIGCVTILPARLTRDLSNRERAHEEFAPHRALEVREVGQIGEDVARDVGVQIDRRAFELHAVAALRDAFEGHFERGVLAVVPGVGVAVLFGR